MLERKRKKEEEPTCAAGLKIVLWISGILSLVFGLWAFLPKEIIAGIFNIYGGLIGDELEFTGGPIETYLLRLMLMSFIVFGVFLILAARDPIRYGMIVALTIALCGAYAVFVPIAGTLSGVGFKWYVLDFVPALVLFVLLIVFSRRKASTG